MVTLTLGFLGDNGDMGPWAMRFGQGFGYGTFCANPGLTRDASQVRFNGLDQPVANVTPDFRKSLTVEDAMEEHVLIAYAMNGESLPMLNGFPLRLVVPGWYATYWVKMLSEVEVLNGADQSFWTKQAYQIPDNPCQCVMPGKIAIRHRPHGTNDHPFLHYQF